MKTDRICEKVCKNILHRYIKNGAVVQMTGR